MEIGEHNFIVAQVELGIFYWWANIIGGFIFEKVKFENASSICEFT